jgi:hypothetical protein
VFGTQSSNNKEGSMIRSVVTALCVLSLPACTDEPEDESIEELQLAGVHDAALIKDLIKLGIATAKYHNVAKAEADGHVLLPGLDHCFDNPGVGAMGYHYIDPNQLDLVLEVTQPEALVYHTTPGGHLRLGAVEYIVPAAPWDAAHPGHHPELLGQHLHLNAALGVYVLHVWLWKFNPSGIFEDWNPNVSCP